MNELEQYFEKNDKRLINKYQHYFDVYDRHFSKYTNTFSGVTGGVGATYNFTSHFSANS